MGCVRLRGPPHPPCVLLVLQERGALSPPAGKGPGRPRLASSRVVCWPARPPSNPQTQTGLAVFGQQQSCSHLSQEGARLREGDLTGCSRKTVLSGSKVAGTVCLARSAPGTPAGRHHLLGPSCPGLHVGLGCPGEGKVARVRSPTAPGDPAGRAGCVLSYDAPPASGEAEALRPQTWSLAPERRPGPGGTLAGQERSLRARLTLQ